MVFSCRLTSLTIALCVFLSQATQAQESIWLTNMDEALAAAKAESKPIVVDFTGSDWCVWCVRLDTEVFDTEAFIEQAPESFVLVKLDYPRNKSILTEAEQAHNKLWSDKFGINAFPTVLLLDPEGRPFAKTGYQDGGPDKYLELLSKKRERLERRDALLAEAEGLKDFDRAKKLDEALGELDENFAADHYADIIAEIGKIDAEDALGLRTKYFAAEDQEKQEMILEKIRLAGRRSSTAVALKSINAALEERKLPSAMKLEALQIKLAVLRAGGMHAEMTATIDEMLGLEGLPSSTYQSLLVQKAYALVSQSKPDEAIGLLSDRIAATLENRQLYVTRGELLARLNRHEEALKDFEVAWNHARTDYDLLLELAIARAESYVALERNEEALALLDKAATNASIPADAQAEVLIQKAMILRDLERDDDAELAERQALAKISDPKEREQLRQLIESLKN